MEKSRPSVRSFFFSFFFFLLWGMGLHGNSEVSDVCLVWSRGPRVLVHISTSVLWRENGWVFIWMLVSRQPQPLSTAEKLWLGSSVYACAKCVCICVCLHAKVCVVCMRVCVCVGVRFVSPVFSQRRFTEYLLPPLATLPCREKN